MLPAIFFVIGSAVGSFTHLVSDRLHVASIFGGRSHCDSCGKKLTFLELFPIISYVIQKGKCKTCGHTLPFSYLITEIIFGFLFALLYILFLKDKGLNYYSLFLTVFYTLFFVISGVLVLYDIKHRILPASLLYSFLLLSFIILVLRYLASGSIFELLSPFVLSLPVYFLYLLTKKKGIGFGDVILLAGVGMFLGVEQGIAAALIAVWSAAIVGIGLQLWNKEKFHRKYALPFAPFIIFGMFAALFTDTTVWTIIEFFTI